MIAVAVGIANEVERHPADAGFGAAILHRIAVEVVPDEVADAAVEGRRVLTRDRDADRELAEQMFRISVVPGVRLAKLSMVTLNVTS